MSTLRLARAAARPRPRRPSPRFASSSSSSSSSATSATVETAQKRAQDAVSGAQKGAAQVFESAKKFLGPLGDRLGGLLGSYRQPLLYNASVTRELLKQIYIAERLAPPTQLSTIRSAYEVIWSRAKNPEYWREVARNGEWAKIGVYAVEAYGIFKIGEIVGRRSIVGYKLE